MKQATRQALLCINRRFYASGAADEFSRSRTRPWTGWQRALAELPDLGASPRVLDVGCGNGRFAAYLKAHWPAGYRYLGVDASERLLEMARAHHPGPEAEFELLDFGADPVDLFALGDQELIVVFGVLHHLPSFEARAELLTGLLGLLKTGGALLCTLWQPDLDERLQRRLMPWRHAPEVDETDLEAGDHLLRWGDSDGSARYCHFAGATEAQSLLERLPARLRCSFDADGPGGHANTYLVLEPTS